LQSWLPSHALKYQANLWNWLKVLSLILISLSLFINKPHDLYFLMREGEINSGSFHPTVTSAVHSWGLQRLLRNWHSEVLEIIWYLYRSSSYHRKVLRNEKRNVNCWSGWSLMFPQKNILNCFIFFKSCSTCIFAYYYIQAKTESKLYFLKRGRCRSTRIYDKFKYCFSIISTNSKICIFPWLKLSSGSSSLEGKTSKQPPLLPANCKHYFHRKHHTKKDS
jgi:hypothetical protein